MKNLESGYLNPESTAVNDLITHNHRKVANVLNPLENGLNTGAYVVGRMAGMTVRTIKSLGKGLLGHS